MECKNNNDVTQETSLTYFENNVFEDEGITRDEPNQDHTDLDNQDHTDLVNQDHTDLGDQDLNKGSTPTEHSRHCSDDSGFNSSVSDKDYDSANSQLDDVTRGSLVKSYSRTRKRASDSVTLDTDLALWGLTGTVSSSSSEISVNSDDEVISRKTTRVRRSLRSRHESASSSLSCDTDEPIDSSRLSESDDSSPIEFYIGSDTEPISVRVEEATNPASRDSEPITSRRRIKRKAYKHAQEKKLSPTSLSSELRSLLPCPPAYIQGAGVLTFIMCAVYGVLVMVACSVLGALMPAADGFIKSMMSVDDLEDLKTTLLKRQKRRLAKAKATRRSQGVKVMPTGA